MTSPPLRVTRRPEQLLADDKRVILRYFGFEPRRVRSIVDRLLEIPEPEARRLLGKVVADFGPRHQDLEGALRASCQAAVGALRHPPEIPEDRKLLIGAYLTLEYSIEAAALFNPSMVMHPDQEGLPPGAVRFLMSLRATGEGHLSSIVFRGGVIDAVGDITFDPAPQFAETAWPVPDESLSKSMFRRKLREWGALAGLLGPLLDRLSDVFSPAQLKAALDRANRVPGGRSARRALAAEILWLARANYEVRFPPGCRPDQAVIFPATRHEQRGMEDLRLVRFVDEGGAARYYGTYTAFDGRRVHPMLLETADFRTFHVSTLSGRYARNKGMALFPRTVDGGYFMLSRHDGENLYLLRSEDLHVWDDAEQLQTPTEAWELVQVGNCGSPLETEAGWIVLTHGVGPMRQYCIGALLLDRRDPARVIGRLREPLLAPTTEEREGYVPNVVYSCGSMIHNEQLIIPYAMSDSRTAFATVAVADLLARLRDRGG